MEFSVAHDFSKADHDSIRYVEFQVSNLFFFFSFVIICSTYLGISAV